MAAKIFCSIANQYIVTIRGCVRQSRASDGEKEATLPYAANGSVNLHFRG